MAESKFKLRDIAYYWNGGNPRAAKVEVVIETDAGFSYNLHDISEDGSYLSSWEKGVYDTRLFLSRNECIDSRIAATMKDAIEKIQTLEGMKK